MLIVCKFKAKERNSKGFAVKFMHTLAFCVLFQKILHHHRETLVNRLSFFAYNLSEREVGCRFGRTAENAYLRSDGECRGILHFLCSQGGFMRSAFPFFHKHCRIFRTPCRFLPKHCAKARTACKHSGECGRCFYETLRKIHCVSIFNQKPTL